ncbi:hypothetical protein SUGI_0461270 [Cryptomeria japonica]|uniref:embryo-specific protein ATS3A n=1 Tax=Cryptomeria japonica TaxID=3369 RepID=UPI002408DEC9|nr:embryo-specific protein ATS3A [Cryptomeria japonica]GLJ24183.1 hypothetical protein SUGI_0461270 [Cryptomeria japonica]
MCRRVGCMAFLLLTFAQLHLLQAKEEECSYTLEVKTSCNILDSGTRDRVLVRFGDKSFYDANKTEVLERHLSQSMNEGNAKPFRRCKTDKFNLSGPCVKKQLCYVYFKVEGTDNWRVNDAVIHHEYGNDIFHLNKRLPENAWYGLEYCNENLQMIASFADKKDAHKHVSPKVKPRRKKARA